MPSPYPFQDLAMPTSSPRSTSAFEEIRPRTVTADWRELAPRQVERRAEPEAAAPEPDGVELDDTPAPPPHTFTAAAAAVDPAEVERHRAQGRAQGYEEGVREGKRAGIEQGRTAGKAEWEDRLRVAHGLVDALQTAEEELFQAVKGDLVRILTRVPEKILRRELSLRPGAVADLAEALVRELPRQRDLGLRAHPDDLALIAEHGVRTKDGLSLRTEADPSMSRGGIILITDAGDVDATIETQLDRYLRQARAWLTGDEDGPAAPGEQA